MLGEELFGCWWEAGCCVFLGLLVWLDLWDSEGAAFGGFGDGFVVVFVVGSILIGLLGDLICRRVDII